jgi:hypothetical protein
MRFTFFAVVLPFLLNGLEFVLRSPGNGLPFGLLISLVITLWFWGGVVVTPLYWLVRVARRAWGDGAAAPAPEPAINSTGPDTGRIFGNLN